jgi:CDP-diacylglycerol--serine O-phosphatidyltransferase
LFCGLLALMSIVRGMMEPSEVVAGRYLTNACWLILFSAVLDGLDGMVARMTHSASSFGLNYDSLSDAVAFGVAPAFLMFAKLTQIDEALEMSPYTPRVTNAAVALYTICGVLRLARFNVQVGREEKRSFTGLPIPAAAGTVVATFLVVNRFVGDSKLLFRAILVLMVILSYLMVSTLPFPSLKQVNLKGRKPFELLVASIIVGAILVAFHNALELAAFLGFYAYIMYSLGRKIWGKKPVGVTVPGTDAEEEANRS